MTMLDHLPPVRLAELLAKQTCAEAVYSVARGVDRQDVDLIRSVWWEDGTDDHGGGDGVRGSRDDFAAWATAFPLERSHHAIANVLIEVDGEIARGESYFTAQHNWAMDGTMMTIMAGGRYLDTFEQRDGVWKLHDRHAVYDWSWAEPSTDTFDRVNDDRTFGRRGSTDASYAFFAGARHPVGPLAVQ